MRKIVIILVLVGLAVTMSAQKNLLYKKLSTAETLTDAATYTATFNFSAQDVPTIAVLCDIDSVSGTPAGTATLYQSLDGVNWTSTGQTATWSTGVDTSFAIIDTLFYGVYGKIEIVGTGTQVSQITSYVKQWNKR